MGQNFDASIVYGVVLPEDYIAERYPDADEPEEEFESAVYELCKGTNLGTFLVGYFDGEETTRTIFGLKEPQVDTGYGADDYYCIRFDPKRLDVGDPSAHPEAIRICKLLDLDWLTSGWYLGWSVS
jgi:hypothetical protein